MLSDGGTRDIEECDSGKAAIEAYGRNRPDLVVMDMRMAPVDGLSATRAIVARDRDACVVIVSSFYDESLHQAARKAGAIDCTAKDDLGSLQKHLR